MGNIIMKGVYILTYIIAVTSFLDNDVSAMNKLKHN